MTLLGQFALWLGLMAAVWGAVVGFGGRWKDRPDLARTTIGSSYALAVAMIVAALALWKGLIGHDLIERANRALGKVHVPGCSPVE